MGRLDQIIEEQKTTSTGGRLHKLMEQNPTSEQPKVVEEEKRTFLQGSLRGVGALGRGEIDVMDTVKAAPDTLKRGGSGFVNTFVPAITKFFKTTGSIFGEGLAYAVDKDVREQYEAGNLDILPTITNTTQKDLVKYTVATGIETALYRYIPKLAKKKLLARGGIGALEGIGFAISEGMAKDESIEDVIKKMPSYGVFGSTINIVAPYLGPLVRTELRNTPKAIKNVFKGLYEEVKPPKPKKLGVVSEAAEATPVPIGTPNKRYEEYLRKQGYEPYVPDESLPTIPFGPSVAKKADDGLPVIQMGDDAIPPARLPQGMRYEPISPRVTPGITRAGGEVIQEGAERSVPQKPIGSGIADDVSPQTVAESPTKEQIASGGITESPAVKRRSRQQDFMPVGTGKTQTSRLQQRMAEVYESAPQSQVDQLDEVTYQQMNRPQQMREAAEYVASDPEDAMAVIRGEKNPPKGLLNNSIMLAMEKQAVEAGDALTAMRLGSLRSTRAGQEINILQELDPSNPITQIHQINVARKEMAKKRLKLKKDPAKVVNEIADVAKKEMRSGRMKIDEAEKLLDELIC